MNASPTIGKIAEALAKAQAAFKPAIKDANNPFFKSKYLDLAGAIDATRDALSSNGIAVVQATGMDGDKLMLTTTLIHSSGEWLASGYPITAVKMDPQGIGSATTYARRYSLMAMVGLAAEDDDGEAAHGRTGQPAKVATVTGEVKKKKPTWTDKQTALAGTMRREISDYGGEKGEERFNQLWRDMSYDDPDDVIASLAVLHKEIKDLADKASSKADGA